MCGSEAVNLAKRLTEELANQQAVQCGSLGNSATVAHNSPEEPRSRSFEQSGEKTKGNSNRRNWLRSFFVALSLYVLNA